MKKSVIIAITFIVLIASLLLLYNSSVKNMNNEPASGDSKMYTLKLNEEVDFTNHPVMVLGDKTVTITYLGSTPITPATNEHVALMGNVKFKVSSNTGKSYEVNWSSGTGVDPGPSYFITSNGCHELHIDYQKIHLKKVPDETCGAWAKDLR